MGLEKLIENVRIHLEKKDPPELYAPENASHRKGILDKAHEYWKNLEPKSAIERVYQVASPGGYLLWKLPLDLHEKLNDVLAYSVPIITSANPPAGVASGLTYAVSEAIYGVKTRSLKRVVSGIVGAITHIKKLPITGKSEKLMRDTTSTLEKHFQFANA